MKYYLAPLEGITTYIFRRAYHKTYRPMDKYFTPFIVPHTHKGMSTREWSELNPENNRDMNVVPQILTNNVADFVKTAKMLYGYGYEEVNLNLGCPSKTVVSKGRGSGFLQEPKLLDEFFGQVFDQLDGKVSVKTRVGLESYNEFEDILKVYEKYPLSELIIHPRLQKDYYKNTPNWDVFGEAVDNSHHKLCYNGDIFYKEDYEKFCARFPEIDCLMLGRGIIAFPDLVEQLSGTAIKNDKYKKLRRFHDELIIGYRDYMPDDKNILFKMKEFWSYCQHNFPENPKLWKKIKKCEKMAVYNSLIDEAFAGK